MRLRRSSLHFAFLLLVSAFLCRPAFAYNFGDKTSLSYQNNLLYYNDSVSGNVSGSFLSRGHFITDDLSLVYKFKNNDSFFEFGVDSRFADDPKVETTSTTLKKMYVKFGDKDNEATMGDYMASLSNYTLGTSLKGINYKHKFSDTLEGILLTGTPRSSWTDLWGSNAASQFTRQFYGGRLAKTLGDGSVAGDFVWSSDSRLPAGASQALTEQRVGAVEWAMPAFGTLKLSGETAYSLTRTSDPANGLATTDGWANSVKGEFKIKGFKNSTEFERVGAAFATNSGSASPDQVRWALKNEYRFGGPWKLIANYSTFHNNVARVDGADTSVTKLPEFGFRYDGPDWRPSFSIEAKVRSRGVTSAMTGKTSRTRSLVTSAADKCGTLDCSVDYEYQLVDKSDSSQDELHHILGASLGGSYKIFGGKVVLKPGVRYNLQNDRDRLAVTSDRTDAVSADLGATFPMDYGAKLSYSNNRVLNQVNPNSNKRNFLATLGHSIHGNDSMRWELRYKRNENEFTDDTKNFVEKVIEANLQFSF